MRPEQGRQKDNLWGLLHWELLRALAHTAWGGLHLVYSLSSFWAQLKYPLLIPRTVSHPYYTFSLHPAFSFKYLTIILIERLHMLYLLSSVPRELEGAMPVSTPLYSQSWVYTGGTQIFVEGRKGRKDKSTMTASPLRKQLSNGPSSCSAQILPLPMSEMGTAKVCPAYSLLCVFLVLAN